MQDAVNSTGLIVHVRICKTAETQMEWDREWEDQLILQVKIEFRLNFFNLTLIIHELGLGVKGNWESNYVEKFNLNLILTCNINTMPGVVIEVKNKIVQESHVQNIWTTNYYWLLLISVNR